MEDLLFWDAKIFKIYLHNLSTSAKCMLSIGLGPFSSILKGRTMVVDNSITSELFLHANRSQVEKRFGGKVDDLTGNYWPPTVPSSDFQTINSRKKFLNEEEYHQRFLNGELDSFNVKDSIIHNFSPQTDCQASAFRPLDLDQTIIRKRVNFQGNGAKHGTETENFMEWFEGMASRDNSEIAVVVNTERSRQQKPKVDQSSHMNTYTRQDRFSRNCVNLENRQSKELSRSKVLATERDEDIFENLTTNKRLVSPLSKNPARRGVSQLYLIPAERETADYLFSIAHKSRKQSMILKFEIEDSIITSPSSDDIVIE